MGSLRLIELTDATIFQYLIPSNMMFARYLETSALIMQQLDTQRSRGLDSRMRSMASEIRAGITKYGMVFHPLFGAMYAYEVDGYGSQVRLFIIQKEKGSIFICLSEHYGRCQPPKSAVSIHDGLR